MMLSSASIVSDSVPVTSTTTLPVPPRTISLKSLTSLDSVMTFPDPSTPGLMHERAKNRSEEHGQYDAGTCWHQRQP